MHDIMQATECSTSEYDIMQNDQHQNYGMIQSGQHQNYTTTQSHNTKFTILRISAGVSDQYDI